MTLLSSCSGSTADSVARACPTNFPYSAAEYDRWADEVSATPAGSMFRRVTDDYTATRHEIEDCRKGR